MNRQAKKKVLIYYRYFGLKHSGGDYLPLTLTAELQKFCDVTLALDWEGHLDLALKFYGISLDMSHLRVVTLMPKSYRPTDQNAFMSFLRFRKLKKLAKCADICISGDNLMDFGKPAHHFLSSAAFGDAGFAEYVDTHRIGAASLSRRLRDAADRILRAVLGMRTRREIICDARECVYPNSDYIAGLLRAYYGRFHGTVFYPPTIFELEPRSTARDPLKVVYIGRLEAGKRLADIVAIVERARELSGKDLTLSFAGRPFSEAYRKELENLTIEKPWVELLGELYGEDKADFLLSGTYAVHALRKEAFGISITEYLKAGLIPVVPDEGGAREVVADDELSFRTNEEAAKTLCKLMDDEEFRERKRLRCEARAREFSVDAYMKRQHELLKDIIGS